MLRGMDMYDRIDESLKRETAVFMKLPFIRNVQLTPQLLYFLLQPSGQHFGYFSFSYITRQLPCVYFQLPQMFFELSISGFLLTQVSEQTIFLTDLLPVVSIASVRSFSLSSSNIASYISSVSLDQSGTASTLLGTSEVSVSWLDKVTVLSSWLDLST